MTHAPSPAEGGGAAPARPSLPQPGPAQPASAQPASAQPASAQASSAQPTAAQPAPSQTDVVINGVKEMITSGRLSPGSRLPVEKDLAAALAVSRGSLREGVRALAMMGVLETRQGDGTYVTSLNPTLLLAPMGFMVDLQTPTNSAHLQSVRRVLESEAASRAATRMTAAELDAAARVLDGVEPLLLKADAGAAPDGSPAAVNYEAIMDADIAFHRIIAGASANPALDALIEALASRTVRGRMWRAISDRGAVAETQHEHRAILAELVAREPERARIRMANHLLGVEEFLDTHPSVDTVDSVTPAGSAAAAAATAAAPTQ